MFDYNFVLCVFQILLGHQCEFLRVSVCALLLVVGSFVLCCVRVYLRFYLPGILWIA